MSVRTIVSAVVVFLVFVWMNSTVRAEGEDLSAYYGFGDMEIIKLDWGIGSLKTADFDGDKLTDMAVVNNQKSRIDILLQRKPAAKTSAKKDSPKSSDYNDADINELTYEGRLNQQFLPVSVRVANLVTGDLNSDGVADVAFYGEPAGLYVILQKKTQPKDGAKTSLEWLPAKKIKIDDGLPNTRAIQCCDINGDGKSDIVLAGMNCIYVVLQKEDGQLAEAVKYPTTERTLAVEAGDLNGDKKKDLILIAADNEKPVRVRFGLKSGQLSPQTQYFIEKPRALRVFDYDGDGADEIIMVEAEAGRLDCYKFAAGDSKKSDEYPILVYPLESGRENAKRDLVAADIDGDGLTDVAISDPAAAEIIFYKQAAGQGLTEPVRFPCFSEVVKLSAADIDNDGKNELGVLSTKEKTIGICEYAEGRVGFPQPLDVNGEPLTMEFADLNGDKKIECLYVAKDSNDHRRLAVLWNPRAKDPCAVTIAELKKLETDPEGMRVVDVDQDGLKDVIIFVNQYDPPILVRQTVKGKFAIADSPAARMGLIRSAKIGSIAVADINGDKKEELLVAQRNFARSLVFTGGQKWDVIDQYNAKSTENDISAVAAFDIEGDGSTEILLLDGQKGRLQVLKTGTDKTYRFEKELEVGQWNIKKMLFAGLTGKNVKSLLLFDGDKFALLTPAGSESELVNKFSYETTIKDGKYGRVTAGDINSDGRAELIAVEYTQEYIEVLATGSDFKPVSAMKFKVFEAKSYREDYKERGQEEIEPRELAVADVTGDGHNDLITVIHDRIIIYPQDF